MVLVLERAWTHTRARGSTSSIRWAPSRDIARRRLTTEREGGTTHRRVEAGEGVRAELLQVGAGKRNLFARNRVRNARGLGIDVASYGPVTDTVVRRNRISDAGEDGLAVRLVRKKVEADSSSAKSRLPFR